ncbi:alpha-N-acetylneuraminide alpha-2,8-sialyltransferase-like [Patiria miniata]|uniref:Uncharacterized protein n=1 Tax=Patiria miniata TaxID=46514 RepID=A0A913ZEA6_PATMI|nr:alpha-N-acetylneuraminide alpha-2,8-sialyltransferase-like [Patiria miniata]
MGTNTFYNMSRWAAFWCKRALLRVVFRSFLLMSIILLSISIMVLSPNLYSVNEAHRPTTVSALVTGRQSINSTLHCAIQNGSLSTFARKYANHYTANDVDFLVAVDIIMKRKWQQNSAFSQVFRNDLRAALGDKGKLDRFILTRQNVRWGDKINFYRHKASARISRQLWQLLPKDTFFKPGIIQRCSVVGSSGILKGSQCGHSIDKADFVFRFNLADVKGYETDVGGKTNFTTLNPSLIMIKYSSLRRKEDRTRFAEALKQFKGSLLFLPAFAFKWRYQMLIQAASVAKKSVGLQPIFGHPDHYTSVANLWQKTINGTRWTTTGLHVLSSILDFCEQIDVYGFWPFPTTLDGRAVSYHYHNDINGTTSHSFGKEFRGLVYLHEQGIIKLHIGSC